MDETTVGAAHKTIVDPRGRPARQAIDTSCPRCGAGPDKRVKSGMGDPHPVCSQCGHEWLGERWDG